MRGALGGPRVLLRRLREVMAEPVSAQERLDKIVVLIAANMVAEVCSVYVLRIDNTRGPPSAPRMGEVLWPIHPRAFCPAHILKIGKPAGQPIHGVSSRY